MTVAQHPRVATVTARCPYCPYTDTRPATSGLDPYGMTRQTVHLHIRTTHPAPRTPPSVLHCPERSCGWWTWAANPGELADHAYNCHRTEDAP